MYLLKLTRLPRDIDGMSVYRHLGGFTIKRSRRNWSERNGNQVGGGVPLEWWEVFVGETTDGHPAEETGTLREARIWCDNQYAEHGHTSRVTV